MSKKFKQTLNDIYNSLRYRQWLVYDYRDGVVLHIGTYRECVRVQEESYGGLIVTPVDPTSGWKGGRGKASHKLAAPSTFLGSRKEKTANG